MFFWGGGDTVYIPSKNIIDLNALVILHYEFSFGLWLSILILFHCWQLLTHARWMKEHACAGLLGIEHGSV